MPRNISPEMIAALSASVLRPALFVEAHFGEATVYMWSGIGSVDWNGQSWLGTGSLLSITTPEEGVTVEARGITITLSGFDATLLPETMSDFQLGLPVIVYLGAYDESDNLIADPAISWKGRMDQPTIDVDRDIATISINCESRLIDLNIVVDRRYTNEDQQRDWPGDLGMSFVNSIQQMTLYWAKFPNGNNL